VVSFGVQHPNLSDSPISILEGFLIFYDGPMVKAGRAWGQLGKQHLSPQWSSDVLIISSSLQFPPLPTRARPHRSPAPACRACFRLVVVAAIAAQITKANNILHPDEYYDCHPRKCFKHLCLLVTNRRRRALVILTGLRDGGSVYIRPCSTSSQFYFTTR
jgi:hypothetical protein